LFKELVLLIRYPVERITYSKRVGATRVRNIETILRDLDFGVSPTFVEAYGPDVLVYRESLVIVVEVLNWKRNSWMDEKRALSIRNNFLHYDCLRLLVSSFRNNYVHRIEFFEDVDVDYLDIGFQTQPISYYEFFNTQGLSDDMRPNNEETRSIVRMKLEEYLHEKDLLP
jgi:hypothetical protein